MVCWMWKSHSNYWLSEFNFPLFCPEGLAVAYVQICRTKYMFAWHFFVRNMRPISRYHYWVMGRGESSVKIKNLLNSPLLGSVV